MNKVNLIGRLTKDVELRATQNNVAVASFTLAVNRKFKNTDGERQADFINCVAWRQTAEILAKYTSKGSQIGVSGNIQTRSYEDSEGKRVFVTEVLAEEVNLLGNSNSQGETQGNPKPYEQLSKPNETSNDQYLLPFDL